MCGIVGLIHTHNAPIEPPLVEAMRDCMSHRGPDDAGLWLSKDRSVVLGHRRLSIIDLSAAGHQPMCNEDGTVWISFNGEIFNFPELKAALTMQGHVFRSNCDTEVIIHLYEEYGDACIERLNGQFAFVIWDENKKKALACRDHLGIRPFYYFWDGSRFAFSSELKGVLPVAGKGEIDTAALTDFLVLQYVPAPRTIFRHINKLEAGTMLVLEKGEIRTRRYWQPTPATSYPLQEEECVERLDAMLKASVKRQLLADVPLGVFLSGGVDSSAITHYMAGIAQGPVKAYSVGFEEKEYSELNFATMVANSIPGVEHHAMILKPDNAMTMIQELIGTLDEPFADQAVVPTYLMARYAKESVTVCLSGEGSDEIFGGYDRYWNSIEKVKLLGDLSRLAPDLKPQLHAALTLEYEQYLKNLCSFHLDDLSTLLTVKSRSTDDAVRGRFKELYTGMRVADDLERVQRFDISSYLADNLLFKVDRASMLASLEVRVPFLDPELVNFCIGLPFHYRHRSHINKYILKKLVRGRIPDEVIFRKKMGFSVPIFSWFQKDFGGYLRDTLLSQKSRERGLFRPSTIEAMLDPKRMTEDKHNSLKLWCLLILEEWHRKYYD